MTMFFDEENIFEKIGREFLERLDKVEQEESIFGVQATQEEKTEAYQLLDRLLDSYAGTSLDEAFDGCFQHNSYGRFYVITREKDCDFQLMSMHKAMERLRQDLKLVYGIRYIREKELRENGVEKVDDLLSHPVYGDHAREVINLLERQNPHEIMEFLFSRFGSFSQPQMLYCASMFSPEDFLFFDLETMGLFHRAIILFGTAFFQDGRLIVKQFLVDDFDSEAAALYEFLQLLKSKKALVSFNGRGFDWNYIKERAGYYFIPQPEDIPHFDVYHFSRRLWPGFNTYKLKDLERHILGITREDDVPSEMVPLFYETYIREKNVGPLVPIVYHNQQDLISSARLFVQMQKMVDDD